MPGTESGALPQSHEKKRKSGCAVLIIGFSSILGLLILLYISLVGIGAFLIVADPIEPVDAVVVLSGGAGERLALAIEMHERGIAPNLVITDTDRASNARLRAEAIDGGFPREAVYITDLPVDSTYEEALAVMDLASANGWTRVMVVTDPYHSFRTRFIFRRELSGSGLAVLVRPVEGHWFRSADWFLSKEGWQFVILEIAKFFNYLFLIPK